MPFMDTQPGYAALLLGYMGRSIRAECYDRYCHAPKIVQAVIQQNGRWLRGLLHLTEHAKPHWQTTQAEVDTWLLSAQHYLMLLTSSTQHFFQHSIMGNAADNGAPRIFSDTGYLIRYDLLPIVFAGLGISYLSAIAAADLVQTYGNFWVTTIVLRAIQLALFSDVILPYSLRFFAHTAVLNIVYRKKFDALTKAVRIQHAKTCDKKCTTLQFIKGDVADSFIYLLQTIDLTIDQLYWQLLAAIFAFVQTYEHPLALYSLFLLMQSYVFVQQWRNLLLTTFQLGSATLAARYRDDGVCYKHCFESVNEHTFLSFFLGAVQLGSVWLLQMGVNGFACLPTAMTASIFYLFALGVVHYIRVPEPVETTERSLWMRFLPANRWYSIGVEITERAFEKIKKRIVDSSGKYTNTAWSKVGIKTRACVFLKNELTVYAPWFLRQCYTNLETRWGFKPLLLPALREQRACLLDPIFHQFWTVEAVNIDRVLKTVLEYRRLVQYFSIILGKVKKLESTAAKVPLLSTIITAVIGYIVGPLTDLLDIKLLLEDIPDGCDNLLSCINSGLELIGMPGKTELATLKKSIEDTRKTRVFLRKLLKAAPPDFAEIIANNLKNDLFIRDLIALRVLIHDVLREYSPSMYRAEIADDADDLFALSYFVKTYKEEWQDGGLAVASPEVVLERLESSVYSALTALCKDRDDIEIKETRERIGILTEHRRLLTHRLAKEAPTCAFLKDGKESFEDIERSYPVWRARLVQEFKDISHFELCRFFERRDRIECEERDERNRLVGGAQTEKNKIVLRKATAEAANCDFPEESEYVAVSSPAGFRGAAVNQRRLCGQHAGNSSDWSLDLDEEKIYSSATLLQRRR